MQSRQTTLELVYNYMPTPWLTLTPDLQYIINPHVSGRNATVLGIQASISL